MTALDNSVPFAVTLHVAIWTLHATHSVITHPEPEAAPAPMHDSLLLFGATGDLAQRYLFPSRSRCSNDGNR